jgi:hypothetical protein
LEVLNKDCPVWTIFVTGPWIRRWGFACAEGWKDAEEFMQVGCGDDGRAPGRTQSPRKTPLDMTKEDAAKRRSRYENDEAGF